MKYRGSLLLTLLAVLIVSSCTDENEVTDYQENVKAGKYYTLNQDLFNDLFVPLFQSFYDSILHTHGVRKICGATVNYDPISPHMATEIEFIYLSGIIFVRIACIARTYIWLLLHKILLILQVKQQ